MSRPTKHPCVVTVDKQLAAKNTRITQVAAINLATRATRSRLLVATEKIDPKVRGKAIALFATYCPFCGELIEEQP